jgi:CcmD family protein
MSGWEFVFLAYGIVSMALVLYFVSLKRRLRRAETELEQLRSLEGADKDAKK